MSIVTSCGELNIWWLNSIRESMHKKFISPSGSNCELHMQGTLLSHHMFLLYAQKNPSKTERVLCQNHASSVGEETTLNWEIFFVRNVHHWQGLQNFKTQNNFDTLSKLLSVLNFHGLPRTTKKFNTKILHMRIIKMKISCLTVSRQVD